jgi:hypothetical protein
MARFELRFGPVEVKAPPGDRQKVRLWAVAVREQATPDVRDPVDWLLLTTDPLETARTAWRYLDWYLLRWRIEEFHQALKTGCRVEQRQFESRHNLEVALTFMLLASVRCLFLRTLARDEPEQPAQTVFSADELTLIEAQAEHRRERRSGELTLKQAVILVATMGGFLARKGDGMPGWLTLWRGYATLRERLEGFQLARTALRHGCPDPAALSPPPALLPGKRV